MKTFKQFMLEGKQEDSKNKKMWSSLEPIDRGLPEPHKSAVDAWVGASHDELDKMRGGGPAPHGLMIPKPLESSHEAIHNQNQGLRDVISAHHGSHITAYRGSTPEGAQSYGRLNSVSSWTTRKKAALYFGGGDVAKKSSKVYSPKEVATYDLKPEMSAVEMTDLLIALHLEIVIVDLRVKMLEAIESGYYDLAMTMHFLILVRIDELCNRPSPALNAKLTRPLYRP